MYYRKLIGFNKNMNESFFIQFMLEIQVQFALMITVTFSKLSKGFKGSFVRRDKR